MKKVIVLFLALFVGANLCAQNRELDSLKLLLSKEKTDTGRVKLFSDIGHRYGYGFAKQDSSLWYLQQALELSKKINYTKGELLANFRIADYFYFAGNSPEALKLSLQNFKLAEQFKDTTILFWQARLILWIYRDIGDNKNAMDYAKKLMEFSSPLSRENPSNKRYLIMPNENLGVIYSKLNQFDSAFYYLSLAFKNSLVLNKPENLAVSTYSLGKYFSKIGDSDSASYFYRLCISYAIKSARPDYEGRARLGIANLFYQKGKLDSAFLYTSQSLAEIQNLSALDATLDAYSLLSKLYHSRHLYDSAYKYFLNFVTLKDSLFNQAKIVQAVNFAFNQTLHQQQLEQAKKDAQQQYKNKLKVYILAAVILIFLVIALLLFRNNRNKRKANILLSKQKEEIEEQKKNVESTLSELKATQKQLIQSEKMASLGELTAGIAHEIQNPLNFVNNFSEVNKEMLEELKAERLKPKAEQDEQLKDDLINDVIDNSEKINHHGKRADAIVKGMLQHSRTSTGVKEPTDINALCDEYLRLSYHGIRAKDKSFNAEMKTDFDPSLPKINVVVQDIGRVLLNLINNAFYAVAEKKKLSAQGLSTFERLTTLYEPVIEVSTKKSANQVTITVSDNGNGIPEKIKDKIFQPFFTTKPTGEGTGLGLSLSYDMIKAHGGELKVESREGETQFTITLPIN